MCLVYHQPINVPTAGAQAFMYYSQGERAITHHEFNLDCFVLLLIIIIVLN
jgi:hypothetical protein